LPEWQGILSAGIDRAILPGMDRRHRQGDGRSIVIINQLTVFAVEIESSCHATSTNIDIRTPRIVEDMEVVEVLPQ
jgi:hypothetical protein